MSDASSDMSFFDVACSQRAYRALRPDPVPEPIIEKILEAGTHAPSAGNCQPWRFVVVQDEEVRRQIGEGAQAAWEGFARDLSGDKTTPGFKAVDRLRITQGPLPESAARPDWTPRPLDTAEEAGLAENLMDVEDEDLRRALKALGRAVIGRRTG